MIRAALADGVLEVELCAEPVNEIGPEMLEALESTLDAVDLDRTRALVLWSSAKGGFSAGADLSALYAGLVAERDEDTRGRLLASFVERMHAMLDRLDMLPLTTIGAVNGVCFGGGFELALTCDVLIADSTARFAFPELRLGLLPGFGGIPRLRRDVSNSVVRDLLLTGRSINAKKAQCVGLVSQMVAQGKHLGAARAMARQAARFDPETVRTVKAFMKPSPRTELDVEKRQFLRLAARPLVEQQLRKFVDSKDLWPYLPT